MPSSNSTSDIRRTDRRGAGPLNALSMAMKVIRYNLVDKTFTFRVNDATSNITRKQLDDGEIMRTVVDQDMVSMQGEPNTARYLWKERKKNLP